MNSIIEEAKFEPEPISENTINEIKDDHMKIITSVAMNLSAITLNKPSSFSENIKSDLMPWIIQQSL